MYPLILFKIKSEKLLTNKKKCDIISTEVKPKEDIVAADKIIKIPRSLIHNLSLGDKRVVAYASIIASDWSGLDYESLVNYSLYSGFRGKDGIINQYKELVRNFFEVGYFKKTDGDIIYIDSKEQFGIIYYSEFQKILQLRSESKDNGCRLNHAHILLLLSYLRLYMNYQSGKPVYYSNLLIRISENIGLSVRSISSCLKVLEELKIIHNEELPRYKDDDGGWHSNVRIFVNMKRFGNISYDWRREVQRSARQIRTNQVD